MKKKRMGKGGRKGGKAVLSGIRPDEMTWAHIRNRIIWGSGEWLILALRHSMSDGAKVVGNNVLPGLREKFNAQCEQAVLNGDADWFARQAEAIKRGGNPQRARFNAKVVHLFEIAMWGTLGKRGKPTPAGTFTETMASDIYDALEKRALPNGHLLLEGSQFESKERVMEAIHDMAKRLLFGLSKQH